MPEWSDTGFILLTRPFSESKTVVSILTSSHGRHSGLVYGFQSSPKKGMLEIGNYVDITWRGRLSEQLGTYHLELVKSPSALFLDDALKLSALSSLCAVLEASLPEREPQSDLYASSLALIDIMMLSEDDLVWLGYFARWELDLLKRIGFGLGLDHCAVSGLTDNLIYVSPSSGNAIHKDHAGIYKDRLLNLPALLCHDGDLSYPPSPEQITQAFTLTGYFLFKRVFNLMHKDLPPARLRLADIITKRYHNSAITSAPSGSENSAPNNSDPSNSVPNNSEIGNSDPSNSGTGNSEIGTGPENSLR